MPGMKGPILIMIALVALMALTCAAAQPSFPYCTCSEKGWASSPFALVSTGPARVRPGSVELGFQLEAKQGWTSNGSPCAQALATLGVAKLHIASSLACIGRGPVEVFINDVLCTECRVEEAPNVPGFAQLRVKFRTPVTQSAAIRIVGFGPCSTPTALLDSSGDSQAVVVRYAVFSTQQLKPRVCCPRSSLRVPLIGVYEPPIRSSLPPPRPSPRVHSPPPPRSPSPSPPPPPSPSPSHLPPPPVGGSPASPSPSPPRPRPPPPPPGSGLVSCTGASTNGGVCAASALPTNLGVCINRACCGSQGAALLQKQIIGQVEKLVFGSNDTAEFSVAGGLTGLLRLGPAGPAQVKLTLDGVVYTATFGNTDALLAVSGSNGVQLTIYPPSSGRVRVVFFSQTFGSSDFQVPFDIPSGTNGRRRLQQGGGGGSNVGGNNPCVPPAARSFCAGFGLTSAPAAMALSDALRDLAANIALELQQSLELSSDSLGMVCGEVLAGVATVTTSCSAISALKAFKKVSTCANPPPLPPQAACDSPVSQSGNQGTFSYTVLVGAGTRVNLQYDAQSIPDIYRVFDAATGTKLFQVAAGASGYCIEPDAPGAGSVNIIKPFASTSLIVAVEAPCDSTVWSFTLNCATR